MIHKYYKWTQVIVATWLFLTLAACTALSGGRYIGALATPPPDLGLQGMTADLEVRLHHLILPDGPGSWVQGAKWNEVVLGVKNVSSSDVVIERVSLIDAQGIYVRSFELYDDLAAQLRPKPSESFERGASDNALIGMTGIAGAFIPIPFFGPLAGAAIGASQAGDTLSTTKTVEAAQEEFSKRRLCRDHLSASHCLELSGGASVRGSVFFPTTGQPKILVVTYRKGGRGIESQVRIPLAGVSTSLPVPATAQLP